MKKTWPMLKFLILAAAFSALGYFAALKDAAVRKVDAKRYEATYLLHATALLEDRKADEAILALQAPLAATLGSLVDFHKQLKPSEARQIEPIMHRISSYLKKKQHQWGGALNLDVSNPSAAADTITNPVIQPNSLIGDWISYVDSHVTSSDR